MLDFKKNIHSERVILRPMKLNDFEQMKNLTKNSQMWYYFTSDLSNEKILKKWIESAVMDLKEHNSLPFTITDVITNEIIGATRIGNLSEADNRVEIGWTWISEKYQGTGINGHVKNLLFDFLFNETKIFRIEFKTDVLNIPARKGMQKVGLVEEGVLRSHTLMTNNRRRDTIYYSLLRNEWENK